ncbi:diacylglycerol kinase family protein [Propioniciclava soli]|uniref:Diacylglycerol kinase family protein n=1 Tax=Propioniciclava soli TaxID=2775081 RepID=A0ABZ3C7T4_9ACTN
MRAKIGPAHVFFLVTTALFILWTWLTLGTSALAGLDALSDGPGVDPASPWGQVLAAIAVVTVPVVQFVGLALLAFWASRRRLNNLAWAAGLAIPFTFGAYQGLKALFARPRPAGVPPLITAEGYSYPSAHMAALTVLCVMLVAGLILVRQRHLFIWLAAAGLTLLWWFIAYDRWALRAHHLTDIIGGGFLGGALASLALALAGVHVGKLPELTRAATKDDKPTRLAAVIYNPTKIPDPVVFRRHVQGECAERGWQVPLWLETEADNPGESATRRALRRKADLVMVAGGDGTVRAVCGAMSGSSTPVAILPAGTGNLLARNLHVPLDMADALTTAFDGTPRTIDLVEIKADDQAAEASAVMAGMGTDAAIMGDTNEDLKKVVGPAAYVVAAANALNRPPFDARLEADTKTPEQVTASMVLIANVGQIQGQLDVAPDASPDDGLLDILVATPQNVGEWAAMATSMLTKSDTRGVHRAQAKTLVIETSEPVAYQLDGDAVGECRRLEATIVPGAVRVMTPASTPRS